MTNRPVWLAARTQSVDETRSLAASLAGIAAAGDLMLLAGELGAGKTAFVQGFGGALGVTEPITSPTFALAQRYDGDLVVHHLDVYRLDQLHEVIDLGIGELLDEGVVVIEWGDAVAAALPPDYLEIGLRFGSDPDERIVTLRPLGPRWAARADALAAAVAPWAKAGPDPDGPVGPGAGTGGR
ncbi:MAG: tRNA (adenosine(37)-N6)-threonylcarbamoyltransferase complex ATPase subunit type 1 TsaE [Acidimicrobiales bacterium]